MAAGFLEKKMAERDFFMLRPYCIKFSKTLLFVFIKTYGLKQQILIRTIEALINLFERA